VSAVAGAVIGNRDPPGDSSRGAPPHGLCGYGPWHSLSIFGSLSDDPGGNTHVIDAARCNGQRVILLAGLGFESRDGERAPGAQNLLGPWAYLLAVPSSWPIRPL